MSKPTTEQIMAALLCLSRKLPCHRCFYDGMCGHCKEDAADLIRSQAAQIKQQEERIQELEAELSGLKQSRTMRECTSALIEAIGMLANDTVNPNCHYTEDAYSDLASTVREVAHETD